MNSNEKLGWKSLPIGGVILEAGSSLKYKTGDWRTFKPLVDKEKCVKCWVCWICCPDGAIVIKGRWRGREWMWIEVNYDYCKGCGICAHECLVKAIKMVEEAK